MAISMKWWIINIILIIIMIIYNFTEKWSIILKYPYSNNLQDVVSCQFVIVDCSLSIYNDIIFKKESFLDGI